MIPNLQKKSWPRSSARNKKFAVLKHPHRPMAAGPGKKVYLDEDQLKVPGCAFVLLSFVSPESNQKCDKFGLKVRGAFATREEAEAHVERLMRIDPNFDVFVADCYKWLLCPPKAEEVQDEVYIDKFLNRLIQTHKEEQMKAREAFEEHKREMIESPKTIAEPMKLKSWSEMVDEELEGTPSDLLNELEGR